MKNKNYTDDEGNFIPNVHPLIIIILLVIIGLIIISN